MISRAALPPAPLGLALILLAGPLGACRDEALDFAGLGPWHEARAWLARNANPHPLASNRFQSPVAAASFVDSLYALGADTVYVLNVQADSAWIAREGGPYADALLVRLPGSARARAALFALGAREYAREGFPPERDGGQRYFYFWWD